jgi:hypothetical protein
VRTNAITPAPRARHTKNQKKLIPEFKKQGCIPRGENARKARLHAKECRWDRST